MGVVVVAGGKGARMGSNTPKQFMILGQAPVLAHTINAMAAINPAQIVVVLPQEHIAFWKNLASRFEVAPHEVVEGGAERYDSVKAGLAALGEQIDIVAVHDGVRPLCSKELLARCVESAVQCGSAIPAITVSDSVRIVEESKSGEESRALDRSLLRAVQTPQVFDAMTLRRAYRQEFSPKFTDESSLLEAMGERVRMVEGEKCNIKITTREDLLYAQMILDRRDERDDI